MQNRCPGADFLRSNITISEKNCPECGHEIEIFSCEPYTTCECGFTAYNEIQSCIKWCAYAKDCVGEDTYNKFHESSSGQA